MSDYNKIPSKTGGIPSSGISSSEIFDSGSTSGASTGVAFVRSEVRKLGRMIVAQLNKYLEERVSPLILENQQLRMENAALKSRIEAVERQAEEYRKWETEIWEHVASIDASVDFVEAIREQLEVLVAIQRLSIDDEIQIKQRQDKKVRLLKKLNRRIMSRRDGVDITEMVSDSHHGKG